MAEPVTLFRGARGLNTRFDTTRITNDDGITDLAVALNVDISDSYRVSRRPGYVKKSSRGGHSLFYEFGPALFVSQGKLCRLGTDYSVTELATLEDGQSRMRYCQVPTGAIYFGNGTDKGVYDTVTDRVMPWTNDPSEDLSETVETMRRLRAQYMQGEIDFAEYSTGVEDELWLADQAEYSPLPPRHIEFYRGRIYIAFEQFVLYSEPWAYNAFNLEESFLPFDSVIRMIRRTADGLLVGTEKNVAFLQGRGPDEFTREVISPDPPVEHTDVRVRAEDLTDESRGEAAIWTSTKGICFGARGGLQLNTTRRRVDIPRALTGTAIEHDGGYLSVLNV